MTSSVQKSSFSARECGLINSHLTSSQNFYQVTVEDFDGCEFDYEVEADSYEDAAAQVEAIASESFIQVYNMNIYLAC